MTGTINCTFETPCGWCTKWDKKCDRKIPEPPVLNQCYDLTNKMCENELYHIWECCGISTLGSTYRCKICGAHKTILAKSQDNVTISTYSNDQNYLSCDECDKAGWDMPECKECNTANGFKYFERKKDTK